jgi:hypothetical protein
MRGEEESHSLSSSSYPSSVPTFSHLSLTILRFISASISIGFAIILFVTIETDGSPFYWSLLEAKWMKTTLVDFYCVLAPLCALAAWRERSNPLFSFAYGSLLLLPGNIRCAFLPVAWFSIVLSLVIQSQSCLA